MTSTLFSSGTVVASTWLNEADIASHPNLSAVAGTNTITATGPVSMLAYTRGQIFRFTPQNTNTGAATININGLGAKAITKYGATALVAGDLVAGMGHFIYYDATQFQLINPRNTDLSTTTGSLAASSLSGQVAIANGGTAASTAAAARTNLNVPQIGPAFSANRATSDQTLTDAVYTEIVFNSEDFDTDNYFNTATGRFTPLVAGYYLLNASVSLSGTSIVNAQISLYKNGVAFKRGDVQVPGGTAPNAVSFGVSSLVFFNGTTDFASIYVYADVSAGSPLAGSSTGFTWFNGIFVRP